MVKKFVRSWIFNWVRLQIPLILALGGGGQVESSSLSLATQGVRS